MSLVATDEYVVDECLIRASASEVDLPGVQVWIGTWGIFRLPYEPGTLPDRYGDTGFHLTEGMVREMAKAIASAIALALLIHEGMGN
ncbi:hypothetical protein [Dyella japonica]|uniref:Lysophospholipase L1-like esterase n=1 Tax=Dyella japonica TaxID=231455 RepID=A0ABV2JPB8_9GAMM